MYQKTLTLLLAFVALFFFAYGITGFYTLDSSSHSSCVKESDCSYSVCCPVYGKESGVCAQEFECDSIYFDSQESVQEAPGIEKTVERSYIAVSLGIILLLILVIVGYLEWKAEKKVFKRKSKK